MEKIKADPLALNAIFHAVLKGPSTTPDDFGRVTLADTFSMIYHTFPDWAEVSPGDFSILGRLENLHTLHFPNDPDRPDGFRVVYHRRIDPSVTPERLAALHLPTHREPAYFPVLRETAVSLRRSTAWMGPADGRFDAVFARAFQAVTGRAPAQGENFMDVLGDEDVRFLLAALSGGGHRLLGYPSFTQGDPRPADSPCRALLFQMDSDFADGTDYVMWGDAGAGHFFIRPEDLERRDFSRVYYTWDCG